MLKNKPANELLEHSNNEYEEQVYKVYPTEIKEGKFTFIFHLEPVRCKGKYIVDTRLPIKGHVQERRLNNNNWTIPDSDTVVEKSLSNHNYKYSLKIIGEFQAIPNILFNPAFNSKNILPNRNYPFFAIS